jgi:hypothetical protein
MDHQVEFSVAFQILFTFYDLGANLTLKNWLVFFIADSFDMSF